MDVLQWYFDYDEDGNPGLFANGIEDRYCIYLPFCGEGDSDGGYRIGMARVRLHAGSLSDCIEACNKHANRNG